MSVKGDIFNDFVVQQDENEGIGDRHLIIKYNMNDRQYYIRDLGKGSGTFVRLDVPLTLKNGYIVSYGTSHMSISFVSSEFDRKKGIKSGNFESMKSNS